MKISGTRFYLLRRAPKGRRLQRALITWMLDVHREQGYLEIYPPAMVKGVCLEGTAQLPKFADTVYRDIEEDFYFVPTAEVPVTNMYRDELLDAATLPIRHVAYSPCFRREKMAHGKDTRGIKRGHQFDKVEMVKFVAPETSNDELLKLLDDAEEVLRRLEIPYRVVEMVTADLSFAACKKFDLEAWAPGCGEWLEVSSCSNFGDFQAASRDDSREERCRTNRTSCTRSTAPASRCRARSSPSSKTTSSPTARSSCRKRCAPISAASKRSADSLRTHRHAASGAMIFAIGISFLRSAGAFALEI